MRRPVLARRENGGRLGYDDMNIQLFHSELSVFSKIWKYVRRYKGRLILSVVCSAMISVLNVALIALLKPSVETIFDKIPTTHSTDFLSFLLAPIYSFIENYAEENILGTLAFICFCVLFLSALNGVFKYIQEYMVRWIGNRVILDLSHDLYDRMTNFNAAYFSNNRVGSLISYYTVDLRTIAATIFQVFGRLMLDPLYLLAILLFLLSIQWKLTLLYAVIFPFIIMTMRYYAGKNRRAGRKAQDIMARLGSFLQEHFSYIRLIQGYNMYDRQRGKFQTETQGVFNATMSMARATAASSPINEFLGLFAICCILMLGGWMMKSDRSGVFGGGVFVTYIMALVSLYQPVKRLERAFQEIQIGAAAAERIFQSLETNASLPEKPDAAEISSFDRDIVFDKVSFSFDGKTKVLKDISFTVRKGEHIAIVGPSGAGKTTLINLIPRFYDPIAGGVQLDGADLRSLKLEPLRRLISFVSQDVMIFGDTAWMNLTCGETRYTPEQVMKAAQAAYADEFLLALPQGLDAVIGERGESLSGGQCQRIAIARAFLRDTPILIFDEATSSLDSESELHIKHSLERLMKGRTTFVIAHRLSTILHADRIIVLDRGDLVDIGPHRVLIQRCELYQRLYHLQFNPGETAPSAGEAVIGR